MGMLSMISSVGKGQVGLPSRGFHGKGGGDGGIVADGISFVQLSELRGGTGGTWVDGWSVFPLISGWFGSRGKSFVLLAECEVVVVSGVGERVLVALMRGGG